MTIRSSEFFIFDNKYSTDFGILNVNISSGMLEESFVASRQINEVKIRGREKPYFTGISHSPLTLTLTFAFQDEFDSEKLRAVSRWLSTEYYKPLIFSDNLDRIYYATLEGETRLIHNGASQGYITLNMRCDSPYSYSPVYQTQEYDLSSNPVGGTTIQLENHGDIDINPKISFEKIGDGDFSIVNTSNRGIPFTFTGLFNGEHIFVDCENEVILSDSVPTIYRYSNFNNNYLSLVFGVNNLQVYGNAKLVFSYQFKLLQG